MRVSQWSPNDFHELTGAQGGKLWLQEIPNLAESKLEGAFPFPGGLPRCGVPRGRNV